MPRNASRTLYFSTITTREITSGTSPDCRGTPNFSRKPFSIRAMISIQIPPLFHTG